MAQRSTIEWTDASWNPIRGCSRVSEGCRNCYAERQAARFRGKGQPYEGLVTIANGHPQWTGKVRLVPQILEEPWRWKKPRRIFVNSMSDLFHENVSTTSIVEIFEVMVHAKQHTFQILTKRPARMLHLLAYPKDGLRCDSAEHHRLLCTMPLPNVWLGVSVEDQQTADERIPLLLETPAALRWVSYEPALGPVDFTPWLHLEQTSTVIDWLVAGGESGPGARPPHPSWFREARDQCEAAGVPFFFKQWGEWTHTRKTQVEFLLDPGDGRPNQWRTVWPDGTRGQGDRYVNGGGGAFMQRVGKKAAGALLDGREYREFPEPARAAVA